MAIRVRRRAWYRDVDESSRRRLGWYTARLTMTPFFVLFVLGAALFFAPDDLRRRASRSWKELWS